MPFARIVSNVSELSDRLSARACRLNNLTTHLLDRVDEKLPWFFGCALSVLAGTLCLFWGLHDALSEYALNRENDLKAGVMMWILGWLFAYVYYSEVKRQRYIKHRNNGSSGVNHHRMKSNQKFRQGADDEGNVLIGAVIGAVLVLAVGLSLTTTVVSFVNSSFAALTGNTAAQNLVNIIPIFYILGLVAASIGIVFVGMKFTS